MPAKRRIYSSAHFSRFQEIYSGFCTVPAQGIWRAFESHRVNHELEDEGLLPSMGRVGSAYDNALAESFVATLKAELLYRNTWPTRQATKAAIFEYIEGFYNSRRRHSALGYLSPAEFEQVSLLEEDAA